jgi:tripartite-type tricarboxylate transporter receptor subunit TctC
VRPDHEHHGPDQGRQDQGLRRDLREAGASLPDVPTLDEQGLKGADVGIWHGLYAPKGTPKPVIDKLVAAMQAALKDPATQAKFTELGAVTYGPDKQTPQALQAHLKSEIDRWSPIIKKAGVYAD